MHKHIDHRRDNQADKRHEQQRAHTRKVAVGEETVDTHRTERPSRNKEGLGYGRLRIYYKYRGKHEAVDHSEDIEQQ